MALKDWKKDSYLTGTGFAKYGNENKGFIVIEDIKEKPDSKFGLYRKGKVEAYRVAINVGGLNYSYKYFKTKSQALKFAKSYMKTH
jgi:hypothetical protein